jgi:hypothetical protein
MAVEMVLESLVLWVNQRWTVLYASEQVAWQCWSLRWTMAVLKLSSSNFHGAFRNLNCGHSRSLNAERLASPPSVKGDSSGRKKDDDVASFFLNRLHLI